MYRQSPTFLSITNHHARELCQNTCQKQREQQKKSYVKTFQNTGQKQKEKEKKSCQNTDQEQKEKHKIGIDISDSQSIYYRSNKMMN